MFDSVRKIAEFAAQKWSGAIESLRLVSISANYVFSFKASGEKRFLRLTPARQRTKEQIAAELDFVVYLRRNGVNAMLPAASDSGRLIEEMNFDDARLFACVFEAAGGDAFTFNSAEFPGEHFKLRGRVLGEIHNLSKKYLPASDCRRFSWDEDVLLVETARFLPASETIVRKEFLRLKERLAHFPKTNETFGLIHGDFGETNYLYQNGRLNVFDFDDSCYHWFIYDLAVCMYPHGWRPRSLRLLDSLLEGYAEKNNLSFTLDEMTMFCQWRLIYMFLVYARKWGFDDLSPQRAEWFARKRENIARGYSLINSS